MWRTLRPSAGQAQQWVSVAVLYVMTQGQHNHTAVVNYTQAYPSNLQNIKSEPGLQQAAAAQQIKVEPSAEYAAGGYYAGDEDNSYDNYDMYYDQAGGMYIEPGGSFSDAGQFDDDACQVVEYNKPRAPKSKVLLIEFYDSLFHLPNNSTIDGDYAACWHTG